MSEFSILTGGKVPDPPAKRKRTDYTPLLDMARKEKGDWVALRGETDEARGRMSSLASRINAGRLTGTEPGEFEARVSDGVMWLRLDVNYEPAADENEPEMAPNPITGEPNE